MSGSARLIRKPTTTSGASAAASRSVRGPMSATLNWRSPSMNATSSIAGGPEARTQRGAVAQVGRVVDGADDAGVGGGQRVGDGRGGVARAVIDGDDLERVGEGRQRLERLLDEALEVGLLVVGREEVGQARDAGRG